MYKRQVNVLYTTCASKCATDTISDEMYGPQTFFGDAMILTPTEKRVRLKIRIVCSSRSCHCFVFCKSDYNTLRDAYSLVAQAIDEQLDPSYIKRWIR